MRRTLLSALVGASLLLVGFATPSAMAGGRAQSVTCSLDAVANLDPGLTLVAQSQTVTVGIDPEPVGQLTNCQAPISGVTGTVQAKLSGNLSCTSGTATGRALVTWYRNGAKRATSLVSLGIDVGTGSMSGTVIAGVLKGEPVTASVSVSPLNGDCFFTRVTRADVSGTISA